MEKRLNSRNSSQTNRILDAIEDLQIKLSSLNLPEELKAMFHVSLTLLNNFNKLF